MRHLELEKLEDHKLIQRSEAQIAVLEKGSLEDRREIIEFHEKCKSREEHNNNLEDQVNGFFQTFLFHRNFNLEFNEKTPTKDKLTKMKIIKVDVLQTES